MIKNTFRRNKKLTNGVTKSYYSSAVKSVGERDLREKKNINVQINFSKG